MLRGRGASQPWDRLPGRQVQRRDASDVTSTDGAGPASIKAMASAVRPSAITCRSPSTARPGDVPRGPVARGECLPRDRSWRRSRCTRGRRQWHTPRSRRGAASMTMSQCLRLSCIRTQVTLPHRDAARRDAACCRGTRQEATRSGRASACCRTAATSPSRTERRYVGDQQHRRIRWAQPFPRTRNRPERSRPVYQGRCFGQE